MAGHGVCGFHPANCRAVEETFPSEDTSDASGTSSAQDIPSTGVEMMILPLALLAVGSGAILVIRKKK